MVPEQPVAAEIPPMIAALYSVSEQVPLVVANLVLQRVKAARTQYADTMSMCCGGACHNVMQSDAI